tara:strand:+ start:33287 stop:33973 length:687 start_codon:yes stop_codon:yes gene_type:complete
MYRSIALITLLFAVVSALTLITSVPVGWKFLFLVLVFAALFGGFSYREKQRWPELWAIWTFSTVVSVFQVLPDWFLSQVLGVLVFPEDGLFKFGTVSGYMAGLWAIPFFFTLLAARSYQGSFSSTQWLSHGFSVRAGGVAAAVALLIFATSEATLWILGSWYARDVMMLGHVALYVLIPEALLGFFLYQYFHTSQGQRPLVVVLNGLKVSILYTGCLALSYLFLEKVA